MSVAFQTVGSGCVKKMVMSSAPAKILIGISLDPNDSKELLSWAIRVIARPNDNIVALHVLVSEESKKGKLINKDDAKFRQAKTHVTSVLGEFVKTCQSKQVNLEAKVGVCTSVGRGLIEEAKSISADFLLLLGSRNHSKKTSRIYCLEHAPEGCTVISVGKSRQSQQMIISNSNSAHFDETDQWSSRWSNKNSDYGCEAVAVQHSIVPKRKVQKLSPTAFLDALDQDDSSSFGNSTISRSGSGSGTPPSEPKCKAQSSIKKQIMSPYKLISSFFSSPLKKRMPTLSSNKEKQQPLMKCFSYEEISNATNNFHQDNIVGRGGYSEVYRGDLSDGRAIAVKKLAKDNHDENKEKEFLTELGIIGHLCHPNTAKLVGCCIENGLYLIFNFSETGTLASALHGKINEPLLDWAVRYKIALGVARGLHYLHKCCKHRIIHRDIKASNVLLGPDYEPQIIDFGLAKWLPNKWTHHAVIPIEGTFGYLAPEYFMHGIVDEKTDVFAFGVLLLEIITGRPPVDSSKQNLLLWAKPLMESGNVTELADPKLKGEYDEDEMHRSVRTACYCVRQSAVWRPSMSEVLELLISGDDTEVAKRWRMPKFTSDDLDDLSMVFGYDVPTDISLEEFL